MQDAKLIADISHKTFYDTFASQNRKEDMDKFLNEQFTKGRLMIEVGQRENLFLLAYDGDALAGYAKLRNGQKPYELQGKNALEIARLYAASPWIGKGVGKVLMQACIDIAREMSKEVVWLGVWEKNQRAIDFYQRWGFEKFGDVEFLLGDDLQNDWLMKKHL